MSHSSLLSHSLFFYFDFYSLSKQKSLFVLVKHLRDINLKLFIFLTYFRELKQNLLELRSKKAFRVFFCCPWERFLIALLSKPRYRDLEYPEDQEVRHCYISWLRIEVASRQASFPLYQCYWSNFQVLPYRARSRYVPIYSTP